MNINEDYNDYFKLDIDTVFRKIDFARKYAGLVSDFNKWDGVEIAMPSPNIIKMCKELGYEVKYTKEKGYFNTSSVGDLVCIAAFSCKASCFELGSNFKLANKRILLAAAPWGIYNRLLSSEARKGNPIFNNEIQAKEILTRYFALYEELKNGLINYIESDEFKDNLNKSNLVTDKSFNEISNKGADVLQANSIESAEMFVISFNKKYNNKLDFSTESLQTLELVLSEMADFASEMSESLKVKYIEAAASYFLEIVRRVKGGYYIWNTELNQPVLVFGGPDFNISLPAFEKIKQRLENKKSEKIVDYYNRFLAEINKIKSGESNIFM
ncbi:MAG: hypothetical protein K2W79_06045 [Hydrotalea flava]|nr:hypothetical protein [Hydrotalea flava]